MVMRKQHQHHQPGGSRKAMHMYKSIWSCRWLGIYRKPWNLLMLLAVMALAPPFFLHFRLKRIHQMQMDNCGWLVNPPLVCAHGGDATDAFHNTIAAFRSALQSRVECIEIDVSQSFDGVLFALHDRDVQRISGKNTSTVGYLSAEEINELNLAVRSSENRDDKFPTIEEALMLVSNSVQHVILDAKVVPPLYEKSLAENIVTAVQRTRCVNCIVWATSDNLVRDIIRLSPNTSVGYIVMKDYSTGSISNLLRMERARVVGISHPLIDEKAVQILRGRNKKIYAWTVDDEISMRKMLSKRVDAIISNRPTVLQNLMHNTRVQCLEEGLSLS